MIRSGDDANPMRVAKPEEQIQLEGEVLPGTGTAERGETNPPSINEVFNYAVRCIALMKERCRPTHDDEDIVQQVMLAYIQRREEVVIRDWQAWISWMSRKRAIDLARKHDKGQVAENRHLALSPLPEGGNTPDDCLVQQDELQLLRKAVACLSPKHARSDQCKIQR